MSDPVSEEPAEIESPPDETAVPPLGVELAGTELPSSALPHAAAGVQPGVLPGPGPMLPSPYYPWGLWGMFGLLFLITTACGFRGIRSLGDFWLAGAQDLPFIVFALLAHAGERRYWARGVLLAAYFVFGQVLLVAASVGLAFCSAAIPRAGSTTPDMNMRLLLANCVEFAFLGFLTTALAVILFLPAVRARVARRLPIDPESFVHAAALSLVGISAFWSVGQLLVTESRPALLRMMALAPPEEMGLGTVVFALCWSGAVALAGAGFPTRRNLPEALVRLGLLAPNRRQVAVGVGAGILLAAASIPLDWVLGQVFQVLHIPRTDTAAFGKLLEPLLTPAGAALIGITAGVGEEMVFRGALQPRLGLGLSNFLFAGVHALQYGFDGLIAVFLIGLALGVLRRRTNTTVCCLVHGLYDFILVMMEVLTK